MSEVTQATVRGDGDRFGFLTFAAHLWAVLALALSNALFLVSIATVPFAFGSSAGFGFHRLQRFAALFKPLGFYVLAVLISVAVSRDPASSLVEADELMGLIGVLLAILWVRTEPRVRRVLDGIVMVATGSAVWGLTQFLTGYGDLGHRIRGPFSHYMTFAGVLLLADLILVARFACRRPRLKDWRWVACALITAALLGSLTRSSWVALALALLVVVLVRKPRSLLVWVPAAVLAVAMLVTPVRERVFSIVDLQNPSNYDRLSMLDAGLVMLEERPFFGLGPGMARRFYPIYRPLSAPRHSVPHLHNTYLQIAADSGLVGLAAYLWLMGAALFAGYRGYLESRSLPGHSGARFEELYLASFLALVGFSLAGLFEANWLDTEVQRLTLFLLTVPFLLRAREQDSDAVTSGVAK